ncbi:MAG: hypothetical protein ACM3ZS_10780 [Nitrososphaerota archaeon]|jgi:hypothetical protein
MAKPDKDIKRDLKKLKLIDWVLQNLKNPNVEICSLIESRIIETIEEIKKKYSIFESDILDSELRILDWIFYRVCKDQLLILQNKFS